MAGMIIDEYEFPPFALDEALASEVEPPPFAVGPSLPFVADLEGGGDDGDYDDNDGYPMASLAETCLSCVSSDECCAAGVGPEEEAKDDGEAAALLSPRGVGSLVHEYGDECLTPPPLRPARAASAAFHDPHDSATPVRSPHQSQLQRRRLDATEEDSLLISPPMSEGEIADAFRGGPASPDAEDEHDEGGGIVICPPSAESSRCGGGGRSRSAEEDVAATTGFVPPQADVGGGRRSLNFTQLLNAADVDGREEGDGDCDDGEDDWVIQSPAGAVSGNNGRDGSDLRRSETVSERVPPPRTLWDRRTTEPPVLPQLTPTAPAEAIRPNQDERPRPGRRRRQSAAQRGPMSRSRVERLGPDSFRATSYLPAPCTVSEVVNAVANPDLMAAWFEPVGGSEIYAEDGRRKLTMRGDGSLIRETMDRGNNSPVAGAADENRQYDGEWVEVMTPPLTPPSGALASCTSKFMDGFWSCLGFPQHGSVTMFIERPRNQVGLTVGPYAGGVVAAHTITVRDDTGFMDEASGSCQTIVPPGRPPGGVVVTDTVRLRMEGEGDFRDLILPFGGTPCNCASPSLPAFASQTALSFDRLGALLVAGDDDDFFHDGEGGSDLFAPSFFGGGSGGGGQEDGRTPLLG